jgi:hypothetical protein
VVAVRPVHEVIVNHEAIAAHEVIEVIAVVEVMIQVAPLPLPPFGSEYAMYCIGWRNAQEAQSKFFCFTLDHHPFCQSPTF